MPRARFPSICSRCDQGIAVGDPFVKRDGKALHPHCASGSEDE